MGRVARRLMSGGFVLAALSIVAISAIPRTAVSAGGYKLVVNPANPVTSLKRSDVADMFLGKATKWPDGGRAVPVDQSAVSAVRAAFTREVLGKNVDEVVNHWQQAVFSGRGVPPKAKGSDQEVMDFVATNVGAVGYVSPETPADKVKAIKVEP